MARLSSWLSPEVTSALGWALIHSLWQCLAVSALVAVLMAFSRRPSIRYLVGVSALVLMLAAPVATFVILVHSAARVEASASPGFLASIGPATAPPTVAATPVVTMSKVTNKDLVRALEASPSRILSPSLLPWLVAAWLGGVAFFSLRLAGGFLLLEHRRRRLSVVPSAHILGMCHEVQRELGLERVIRYLECGWLQVPAVIGWLRPIVLIPIAALTGLTEDQLRAVIAHELAHIRRFDAFVNLFQVLVETLLFYHPAVWWLNKRIHAERELCCDEIAVAASGSRVEYAQALTLMAAWESAPRLAMAANRGPLSERVLHILGRKPSGAGQRMIGLTGSVLFLVAAVPAANTLFTIAAPPIAQAKESVRAVLIASQDTVDRLARQVLRADEPRTSLSSPNQIHQAAPIMPQAAPDQTEIAQEAIPERMSPPPADLSGLPPIDALTTPTVVAANAPPAATPSNQLTATASSSAPMLPNGMRTRTEPQLACLLGFQGPKPVAPSACYNRLFQRGRSDVGYCAQEYVDETRDNCPHGWIEAVDYLGANAAGADVYEVQYRHTDSAYIILPPGPDEKSERFWIKIGPLTRVMPPSLVRVTSPANEKMSMYRRPSNWAPSNGLLAPSSGQSPSNASLANAPAASTPLHPQTEAGMACLLGLAPWGCQDVMFDTKTSANAKWETTACAGPNVPFGEMGPIPTCNHGPLEAVDYFGSNASGADVYRVQYMHADFTYVIMPPGPDGKIGKFWIRGGNPNGITDSSLTRVTAPTLARAIYRRAKINTPATPATHDQSAASAAGGPTIGTGALWAAQNEHAVAPSTPSGVGDPTLVVCRAPQPLAGSSQSGPEVCLYNYEWLKVAMNGKDVAPDGKSLIDRSTVKDPTGEGDPDAITCRTPRILDGGATIARYSPVVCRPNSFWADLIKNHQTVDLNGNILRRVNNAPMPMPGFAFQSRLNADSGRQQYGPASGTP